MNVRYKSFIIQNSALLGINSHFQFASSTTTATLHYCNSKPIIKVNDHRYLHCYYCWQPLQYNVLFLGIRLQPEINNINLPQLRWRFIVGYILFTPSFFLSDITLQYYANFKLKRYVNFRLHKPLFRVSNLLKIPRYNHNRIHFQLFPRLLSSLLLISMDTHSICMFLFVPFYLQEKYVHFLVLCACDQDFSLVVKRKWKNIYL